MELVPPFEETEDDLHPFYDGDDAEVIFGLFPLPTDDPEPPPDPPTTPVPAS